VRLLISTKVRLACASNTFSTSPENCFSASFGPIHGKLNSSFSNAVAVVDARPSSASFRARRASSNSYAEFSRKQEKDIVSALERDFATKK
jgi:hypothetical protein